jgi:hypothetical protein
MRSAKTGRSRYSGRLARAFRTGPLAVREGFRLLGVGQLASTAGDYCYATSGLHHFPGGRR